MEGSGKQWLEVSDTSIHTFGASASLLNDSLYVIGGLTAGNRDAHNVIRIHNFDCNSMAWNPIAINARSIVNRAYHASASLGDSFYIFGGTTALLHGAEYVLDEVVKCTPNFEGLKCVSSKSSLSQLKGHSASKVGGRDLLSRIVLFGGLSSEGTCESSDIIVFVGEDAEYKHQDDVLKRIHCSGPSPPPRSYHACAVAGLREEYLIISGGRNNDQIFDDLWLCDLANLLSGRPLEKPKEVVAEVKGAAAKKVNKDEVPLPELFTWHRIRLADSIDSSSRFMHGCWATCAGSLDNGLTIGVFGGVSALGPTEYYNMIQYAVEFDGKECHAQLEAVPEGDGKCNEDDSRYGFATVTIYEHNAPALLFIFGGKSSHCNSYSLVLDESTEIAAHLFACFPAPTDEDDNENSNIKIIKYPNGDVYEGEVFVDVEEEKGGLEEVADSTAQIRHGQGVMKYSDGGLYEGEWQYNIQSGRGKYVTSDQETVYDGVFADNEFHGKGQLSQKNGVIVYKGEFVRGVYDGKGVLLDKANKTIYDGAFVQGMKNGEGELRQVSEDFRSEALGPLIYSGSWKDNKPAGHGTLVLPGGHVYTGGIANGIPEGTGVCKYADGGEYSGSWKGGRRNGAGEYISRNLDEYKGKWVGDVRSGKGLWKSRRGDVYDGLWDSNYPHGKGTMSYNVKETDANSLREKTYNGEWNHGKRHGFGEVLYVNGSVKKGSWKTNKYDEALVDYDAGQ